VEIQRSQPSLQTGTWWTGRPVATRGGRIFQGPNAISWKPGRRAALQFLVSGGELIGELTQHLAHLGFNAASGLLRLQRRSSMARLPASSAR